MIVLFAIVCLMASFAFALRGFGIVGESQSVAQVRLREMLAEPEVEERRDLEFTSLPSEGFAARVTPRRLIAKLQRNLVLAGYPDGWGISRVLSTKVILAGFGLAIGLMRLLGSVSLVNVVFFVGVTVFGYIIPDVVLSGRAARRQAEIQRALPELLDQISISLDSGMSFEAALARIGEMTEGPLADEVVRTVQDIALGVPRRQAYQDLVRRTDVKEMRLFVRAIIQGEEYGVAMAEVVREQSAEMRESRRMRAEAKANEVPVKMLLPLVLCILPTLFIVILGPAIINIVTSLKGAF